MGLRLLYRIIILAAIIALIALSWQLVVSLLLVVAVPMIILLLFSMFVPGLGWLARLVVVALPVAALSVGFRALARLLRPGRSAGRRPVRGGSWSLLGGRSLKGLSVESVEGGLLVVGDYRAAVREVVDALYRAGRSVVVVGGVGLVPDSVRLEDLRVVLLSKTYLNALRLPEDRSERRDAVEKVAAALTVSEGLDAAEVGMLASFIERVSRSGGLTEDDVERLRTEYGPAVAARLRDAVEVLVTSFNAPAPSLEKLLEGRWRVLLLETYGLPRTHRLFVTLYSAYNLRSLMGRGAVVVLTDVEMILPSIHALPYDARHTWLAIHSDLMSLASSGLVMATSSPHVAPELLETVRGILLVSPPHRVAREVGALAGVEIDESHPTLVRRERSGYSAYRIELRDVPPVGVEKARTSALGYYQKVRAEASEAFRGTVLFADFGDQAEEAYRILRAVRYVKGGGEEVAREASAPLRLVRELVEKGYLVEREGLLSLAQLGEEALADFEAKARGRRRVAAKAPPAQSTLEPEEAEGSQHPRQPVQIGIGAYASRPEVLPADLGDVYRLLSDAKAALARGDPLKSTRLAYKALHELLRRVSGVEKGRLPDLAKQASARGVIVSEEEAKRAVGTIARAGRLQRKLEQGAALERGEEEAARVDAEFLISVVERALAALEGSPAPEEIGEVDGDEEPGDSGPVR